MAPAAPPTKDPLRNVRAIPKSPLIDASTIGGNVQPEQKQLSVNAFTRFFLLAPYETKVTQQIRWLESNVWKEGESADGRSGVRVEILAEIEVTKGKHDIPSTYACFYFAVLAPRY
jgi:hypothetical protein